MYELLNSYLQESLDNKKGITFYVNGNAIAGYVIRIIEGGAVEIKNQRSTKALIFLDKVDAIEMS